MGARSRIGVRAYDLVKVVASLSLLAATLGACQRSDAALDASATIATQEAPNPGGPPSSATNASSSLDAKSQATGASSESTASPAVAGPPFRLTEPGCCARAFWRLDSRSLWFIDRPAGGQTGFYAVTLDAPLAPPTLITSTIASLSPDQRWSVAQTRERTTLTRLEDGQTFDVPSAGRAVSFSPDGAQIAWQVGGGPNNAAGGPPADPSNKIHVAAVDGSGDRQVIGLENGSLAGWLDERQLLIRVRQGRDSDVDQLQALPLDGRPARTIFTSERLRGVSLSTDRSWLAYTVSGSTTAGANGLWIAATGEGGAPPRRLDGLFGAFRWRDGHRLAIIPFEPGASSHRVVEMDAATGAQRGLTDPAVTPFRIADGDWSLSPDGRHLAFVSAADDALYAIALP